MEKISHLGSYGIIIKNEEIVLIKKANGPYKDKLDLPGGTIEFCEKPEETLVREMREEVGINIKKFSLFDGNSTIVEWEHHGKPQQIHHIVFFYIIEKYENEIKKEVELTKNNDDSLGAEFYDITKLKKSELSAITILALEKLGYKLMWDLSSRYLKKQRKSMGEWNEFI